MMHALVELLMRFVEKYWSIDTLIRLKADPVTVPAGSTYTDSPISWTAQHDYLFWGYQIWMGHPLEAHPCEADFSFTLEDVGTFEGPSYHWHEKAEEKSRVTVFFTAPVYVRRGTDLTSWRCLINATSSDVTFGDVVLTLFMKYLRW